LGRGREEKSAAPGGRREGTEEGGIGGWRERRVRRMVGFEGKEITEVEKKKGMGQKEEAASGRA
jgi:hypothetical protein